PWRGEPSAASPGVRAGARALRSRGRTPALRARRGRLPRLYAHCLKPPGDVARHLPREPRPAARRIEEIWQGARFDGQTSGSGRRRRAGESVRRGARRARAMDSIELKPLHRARGTVRLPGSKSISNRILLLAALAQGETEIGGLLDADDTRVMQEALKKLGARFSGARVEGVGGAFPIKQAELFLGNAGTALRPLAAALAFSSGEYRLSGVPRMHERPIGDLVDALRGIGARVDYTGSEGFPPLAIRPGKISGENVRVRGDVSSQFLTALLMALPLTGKPSRVEVQGELISKPYVEITLNVMRRFGIEVKRSGWRYFEVPSQSYASPGKILVEGDASSASYFLAAGAIGGGPVRVEGVGRDSIQGDVRFT